MRLQYDLSCDERRGTDGVICLQTLASRKIRIVWLINLLPETI